MKGITGFRLRGTKSEHAAAGAPLPAPPLDGEARDRVVAKVKEMGKSFREMCDDEFGDWLDALPREEFVQFLALSIGTEPGSRPVVFDRPSSLKCLGATCVAPHAGR